MTYTDKIDVIFDDILKQLQLPSPKPYTITQYQIDKLKLNNLLFSKNVPFNIGFLKFSLEEYKNYLINISTSPEQETALEAAKKLEETISIIVTSNDNTERDNAILAFDKQARNSNFSETQLILINCVIIGLATLLLSLGAPVGIAVLTTIMGIAAGGLLGEAIFKQQQANAGNKSILNALRLFSCSKRVNATSETDTRNEEKNHQPQC